MRVSRSRSKSGIRFEWRKPPLPASWCCLLELSRRWLAQRNYCRRRQNHETHRQPDDLGPLCFGTELHPEAQSLFHERYSHHDTVLAPRFQHFSEPRERRFFTGPARIAPTTMLIAPFAECDFNRSEDETQYCFIRAGIHDCRRRNFLYTEKQLWLATRVLIVSAAMAASSALHWRLNSFRTLVVSIGSALYPLTWQRLHELD